MEPDAVLQGFIAGQKLMRYLSFSSMSGRKPVASACTASVSGEIFMTSFRLPRFFHRPIGEQRDSIRPRSGSSSSGCVPDNGDAADEDPGRPSGASRQPSGHPGVVAKKSYWRTAGWGGAFGIVGIIPSLINVSNTNDKI